MLLGQAPMTLPSSGKQGAGLVCQELDVPRKLSSRHRPQRTAIVLVPVTIDAAKHSIHVTGLKGAGRPVARI